MIREIFKKYKVEIEILSPLFIGSGEEWYPNDYIKKEDQIFLIDFDKLFNLCHERKIDFLNIIRNEKFFSKITPSQGKKTQGFDIKKFIDFYKIPVSHIVERKLSLKWNHKRGFRESFPSIKQFIKDNNGNYFIPGSSLKGCLRTLYLWDYLRKRPQLKKFSLIKENNLKKIKKKKDADKKFQKQIESNIDPLFQKFRISDFYFTNSQIAIIQVFRGKIFQFIEVIERGRAEGEIWIEKKGSNTDELNGFLLNYFQKISKEFLFSLSKTKNKTTKLQMRILTGGKVSSLKENEMIIRIGFGKGFDFSTVGGWIKEELGKGGIKFWFKKINIRNLKTVYDFPLTFWKTFDERPLGWIKLTFKEKN